MLRNRHSSQEKPYSYADVTQLHLTFTCSESTTETVEKGVNMFKVNNKTNDVVLVYLLLTLNIFYTFF